MRQASVALAEHIELSGNRHGGRHEIMKPSDRITFFDNLLATFLGHAGTGGHICVAVLGRKEEYVQFKVRPDGILGEVGSRQWGDPERPLAAPAVEALAGLGFVGGGPERNFAKHGCPGRHLSWPPSRMLCCVPRMSSTRTSRRWFTRFTSMTSPPLAPSPSPAT
jgi:hypothetical protein